MRVWLRCLTLTLVCANWVWLGSSVSGADEVDFSRDIRPILSDRCFHCHGPDDKARQANLRFDIGDGKEGPYRVRDGSQAIKAKDLEGSAIWYRLTTTDQDERMPPADSHKKPLSDAQKTLIKNWILQGAAFDGFWAFIPPTGKTLPSVKDQSWSTQRIDRFVMARLEKLGRTPQVPADRRTLIRRVTLDLTGLPPTRDEIRDFLQDQSDGAYEKLVDRLLDQPQYGEQMAKYWLDLVRFADTNGIHHDHYREMTPYRDWVIESFNANLSFDKFIIDQIAGDLHENPTVDQLIASGFNRLHLVIDRGTALPEESFHRNVVDRVTAFGTAFLGLTFECAVCHDHKYDPITQKDFYQLYAFFNNIDAGPETPGKGVHAPFIKVPTPTERQRLRLIESEVAKTTARIDELKAALKKLGPANDPAKTAMANLQQLEKQLKALGAEKAAIERGAAVTLIMKERQEIRPTHILVRGAYDQPGKPVERNTPDFLPPLTSTGPVKTRMDLARWVTDEGNPLAARVTVNRFWQQFFGVGLVKTSENFGAQGEWPSHPELLDDLAYRFVKSGWDVKALVKSFVMSQTYRQSSHAPRAEFLSDPENRLLARGSRFRLDAEMIRDQILSVSGLLNPTMYGKSVKPPQPPNLWKTVSMVSSSTYAFTADTGDKIHRRSVYSFWKRAMPPPQMTIFDAPSRESCIARRERTNTPLQALVLMNEKQYFKAARHFATQVVEQNKQDDAQRLSQLYESVTSQLPDKIELAALNQGLASLRTAYQEDVVAAKAMTADLKLADDRQRIEIAAYTMLINSLFNLDITKTRN